MRRAGSDLPVLLAGLSVLCFLGAFGTICWQVFQWLKTGEWFALPLTYVLSMALDASAYSWLAYPQDWKGIHAILSFVSLSGGFAILGFLFAWLMAAAD